MRRSKSIFRVCAWVCAFAFALTLPMQSRSQVPVADTSKPLIVKTRKSKPTKFWGQVLSVTAQSMKVRSQQNGTVIREFTYTAAVSSKVARTLAKGGYPYGDNVLIDYAPGTDVALSIKGKTFKGG
jgi:hypothetical protein